MYDIANVMRSLGLIEKIKNNENKNVFKWIGSRGFSLLKKEKNSQNAITQNEENKMK